MTVFVELSQSWRSTSVHVALRRITQPPPVGFRASIRDGPGDRIDLLLDEVFARVVIGFITCEDP